MVPVRQERNPGPGPDAQKFSDMSDTLAHELAHLWGRRHTNDRICTGSVLADSDGSFDIFTDWPYDTADVQEIGFDVQDRRTTPANYGDIISYCNNQNVRLWVSPHTYRKLMKGRLRGAYTYGTTSAVKKPGRPAAAAAVVWAIVSGQVNPDGTGSLDPVYQVRSGVDIPESDPAGSHCLRFLGASDAVLGQHCFTPILTSIETGEPLAHKKFVWKLIYPEGTVRLTLLRSGEKLAELQAGPAPELRITSPGAGDKWEGETREVAWTGSDPAGGALLYSVLYSPDDGAVWYPLGMDLREPRLALNPASIRGGAAVKFRVIATSGLTSTAVETGAIEVVQHPSIKASTDTVDFENQKNGTVVVRSFVLANPGTGPLTVSAFRMDNGQFRVTSPTAPVLIPAGEEVVVNVRWQVDTTGDQTSPRSRSRYAGRRRPMVLRSWLSSPRRSTSAKLQLARARNSRSPFATRVCDLDPHGRHRERFAVQVDRRDLPDHHRTSGQFDREGPVHTHSRGCGQRYHHDCEQSPRFTHRREPHGNWTGR